MQIRIWAKAQWAVHRLWAHCSQRFQRQRRGMKRFWSAQHVDSIIYYARTLLKRSHFVSFAYMLELKLRSYVFWPFRWTWSLHHHIEPATMHRTSTQQFVVFRPTDLYNMYISRPNISHVTGMRRAFRFLFLGSQRKSAWLRSWDERHVFDGQINLGE